MAIQLGDGDRRAANDTTRTKPAPCELDNLLRLPAIKRPSDGHQKSYQHKNGNCSSPTSPLLVQPPQLPQAPASPAVQVLRSPNGSHRRTRYDSDNSTTGSMGSSDSSSATAGRKKRQPPPDGGWGWMVVLASFAINLISDGVSLSFGIFLPDLTAYFGVGRSHTAWVVSLFISMPLLAGPIASWLTDRFGCRRVCIVGALLATLGFALSSVSDSLPILYLTFSISGFGLALCYVTSIVIVAYYFEKRRCLATGLSVCGTGVGTFVFAPFMYYLVEEFTWRGALLILAGFFLNMVVSGALMRDLATEEPPTGPGGGVEELDDEHRSLTANRWPPEATEGHLEEDRRMCSSLLQLPTYMSEESPRLPVQVLTEMSANEKGHLKSLLEKYPDLWNDMVKHNDDPYLTVKSSPLIRTIPEYSAFNNGTTVPANCNEDTAAGEARDVRFAICDPVHSDEPQQQTALDVKASTNKGVVAVRNSSLASAASAAGSTRKSSSLRPSRQASIGPLPLLRDRANSVAYLRNLRLQRGSLTYRGAMLNIKRYRLKASSCPNIYRNSMATINESGSSAAEFLEDLKDVVCDMMDVRLLTNFKYALFCLSNFLLNACVDNPYVFIPDYAKSLPSISESSAAFIISIAGVLNTLGVVIVGYVGDKPWIDPSLLYAFCTIIAGLSVAAIPLLRSYLPLATALAIYGFTISANFTLVPEIVVNLISLDNFTGAYGLLLLIQGVASLIGPPTAGWLSDISGSYDSAFYISGLCILASGILVIPVAETWKCSCKPVVQEDPEDPNIEDGERRVGRDYKLEQERLQRINGELVEREANANECNDTSCLSCPPATTLPRSASSTEKLNGMAQSPSRPNQVRFSFDNNQQLNNRTSSTTTRANDPVVQDPTSPLPC